MDRQAYIDQIIDHFEHPRHFGALADPDVVLTGNNPACGDVMIVYLRSSGNGGAVTMSYEGQGCTISQAAASMVMEMLQGVTLAQIDAASVEPLLTKLGPDIASARQRCATLAFNTMKHAARALKNRQSESLQTLEVSKNPEGLL